MIRPRPISSSPRVGIFTPSSPAHIRFRERFEAGVRWLESQGFEVVLGELTGRFEGQGYRTADGRARAAEFDALVADPAIEILISTIGGTNSSSMLEHLDYDALARRRPIVCGYSDVTSLHMAIQRRAGLATLYGPAIVPSFGEQPAPIAETVEAWSRQLGGTWTGTLDVPDRWSNAGGSWTTDAWKEGGRVWNEHPGLTVLRPGEATGRSLAANLNTLMAVAGTPYMPDFDGTILFIEEMSSPMDRFERSLTQLRLSGALEGVRAIVHSRPEFPDACGAPFSEADLLVEILGDLGIPLVTGFDAGHTHPMIALPSGVEFSVEAHESGVRIVQCEPFCDAG